ncbi:MAG: aryl-sulfate sulfotransferase [Phycisphaerales bacterium]|nr:aryl-sulfate sulfotransferase [Phycisphaerales bacterium]
MKPLRMAFAVVIAACTTVAATGQTTLPRPSEVLNRTHVMFQWLPVDGAESYELVVVVDDGSGDPFAGAKPVVSATVPAAMPRTIVTEGLSFGTEYAWRARGIGRRPMPWGPTRHFEVAALPAGFPDVNISTTKGYPIEPGLTMFNLRSPAGLFVGGLAVAVDAIGTPVWAVNIPAGVGDLRLLPNGHVLYESNGHGIEATLENDVVWQSPDGYNVHHEVSPMPNGNYLALVHEFQEVPLPGGGTTTYNGNRIIEFDHVTNEVAWEWNEFDNFSTDDYDVTTGTGDWTHSNAVVYNPLDNSVYHSARHLSRVTRIDYATGNVVYMMGFEMQSGDADFGDNLFSFQHAPQLLPNGHMMLFDNGNRRDHIDQTNETGMSKAIELAFTGDPPTSAEIVWEWTLPLYNFAVGDCDRLPGGNTLVVGGITSQIFEVAPDKTVAWSLETPTAFPDYLIYRAERIHSLLLPIPPDFNGDEHVDGADLGLLLAAWGDCEQGVYCPADLNNDGTVNGADLGLLLAAWGS